MEDRISGNCRPQSFKTQCVAVESRYGIGWGPERLDHIFGECSERRWMEKKG